VPAKKAPAAHPRSIEATLKPVPIASESKAFLSPSTVPLITPLSKPNKKPPNVATMERKIIRGRLSPPWEGFRIIHTHNLIVFGEYLF
jgi:hypothetical protein